MAHTHSRSRPTLVLALWALPIATVPGRTLAQERSEALDVLLEYALADDVLGGQAASFLQAIDEVGGGRIDPNSTGIAALVLEEFAAERLHAYAIEALDQALSTPELEAITTLLEEGAIGELSDMVADFEPEESLEAFARTLATAPPPQDRVELLTRFADAQHAAALYLLVDERVREAAHRVASIATGGQTPPYRNLDPLVERDQLQRGRQFAVLSYLHRLRPAGDALVASATAAYLTSYGQLYVESLSLAMAEAIQLAGLRVAGRLSLR